MPKRPPSFLYGSMIEPRADADGPLFFAVESELGVPVVACRLNGYAIVPKEKYRALRRMAWDLAGREAERIIERIKQ